MTAQASQSIKQHPRFRDDAVLHTLTNSGTVHIVAPDQVPEHADVAAILRY
jgi:hypothetical protein